MKHRPSTEVATVLHKLRWSAERGEWSASVKPEECALLLHVVTDYYTRLNGEAS